MEPGTGRLLKILQTYHFKDVDAEDVDPERHLDLVGGQGDVARHLLPGLLFTLRPCWLPEIQPIETGIKVKSLLLTGNNLNLLGNAGLRRLLSMCLL